MTAPRPADPDTLYRAFSAHAVTCELCQTNATCPYGQHLLEAWQDSERFYANEQEMIEGAFADEDEYPGTLGHA